MISLTQKDLRDCKKYKIKYGSTDKVLIGVQCIENLEEEINFINRISDVIYTTMRRVLSMVSYYQVIPYWKSKRRR